MKERMTALVPEEIYEEWLSSGLLPYEEFNAESRSMVLCIPTYGWIHDVLWDEYGYKIDVEYFYDMSDTPHFEPGTFNWDIINPDENWDHSIDSDYADSWEGAMNSAISRCIEILKEKLS